METQISFCNARINGVGGLPDAAAAALRGARDHRITHPALHQARSFAVCIAQGRRRQPNKEIYVLLAGAACMFIIREDGTVLMQRNSSRGNET